MAGAVAGALPPGGLLVVGASSPIRDLDLMVPRYEVGARRKVDRQPRAVRHRRRPSRPRSAPPSAATAQARDRNLALMGDVTFLHDANGLVLGPDEPRPDLTIVVVNDDGGSIFAMLEQGAPEHADALRPALRHPARRRPGRACARPPARRTGGSSRSAELEHALASPNGGIEVVEVVVAATTGATSTPGSAPCGPESGPRVPRHPGHRGAGRMTRWRSPCCSSPWPSASSPSARWRTGWTSRRPLLLIAAGIAASYLPGVPELHLEPEVVLIGLLPPLLYATAIQSSLVDFNTNRRAIFLLSVGLVVFTTVGIGVVVHTIVPSIEWASAFAIGAVVAPPDAVAATAIGRRIGLPRRVTTILEGESLLNDATALVALRTATAIIVVGRPGWTPGGWPPTSSWAAVGGVPRRSGGLRGRRRGCASRVADPVLDTGDLVRDPVRRLPRAPRRSTPPASSASWSPACCWGTRRRSCRPRSRGSRSG